MIIEKICLELPIKWVNEFKLLGINFYRMQDIIMIMYCNSWTRATSPVPSYIPI